MEGAALVFRLPASVSVVGSKFRHIFGQAAVCRAIPFFLDNCLWTIPQAASLVSSLIYMTTYSFLYPSLSAIPRSIRVRERSGAGVMNFELFFHARNVVSYCDMQPRRSDPEIRVINAAFSFILRVALLKCHLPGQPGTSLLLLSVNEYQIFITVTIISGSTTGFKQRYNLLFT